jgi:hypothetical protein
LSFRCEELLEDEFKINESLTGFCTHPLAIIDINTGDNAPVHRRQYKIPYAQKKIVSNQIEEWLEEGLIREHLV